MAAQLIERIIKNGRLLESSKDDLARLDVLAAAQALVQELETPIETVARLGWGEPTRTAALRVALDLDLLRQLSSEPLTSTQLAHGTKADSELIARVMKHLAANGIAREVGQDLYVATPFTLATKDPAFSGSLTFNFDVMPPVCHSLPEFLAKNEYREPVDGEHGPLQFGLQTEHPFFAYLQERPRLNTAFAGFISGYTQSRPKWVDYYPAEERLVTGSISDTPLIVDVGGSLGVDLMAFQEKFPNVSGDLVLEDTPDVVAQAAQQKLPETIRALAHDFFLPQPTSLRGARAYYTRMVLHDWPDHKSREILKHIRDAMTPHYSKLLITEIVVRDTGAPWQQTSLDWTMMSLLASRERTETQWRELLQSAGFKLNGIWQKDPTKEAVIEAERSD